MMSNRISGVLLITLIVLCAIILIEVISSAPRVETLNPSSNRGAVASRQVRLNLPPLAALSETLERPLFNETRRPPESESDLAPAMPTPLPTGAAANLTVSAIVITDNERAVLLVHPQSGDLTRVVEGETVAGWRLESVENDRAVFSKNGETRETKLRAFGAPPPRRPKQSVPLSPGVKPREREPRRTRLRPTAPEEEPASER